MSDEMKKVKVGDWVGFKCDVEQYGKVIKIQRDQLGNREFKLENTDGFDGDYIGGQTITWQEADRCWVED